MLRKASKLLLTLVLIVAGSVSAMSGVLAFEAQIVPVNAHIENALRITQSFDSFAGNLTMFPEEFAQDQLVVELSGSFQAQNRVNSATLEVYVQCLTGTFWMGDFAFMAATDPGIQLPGGNSLTSPGGPHAGPVPPSKGGGVNVPWVWVGGNPSAACPNLTPVFTGPNAISLDTLDIAGGSASASLFLGLDIPVCDFNYNPATDVNPKPSGYGEPTQVLATGDPRHEDPATDPNCKYDAGMEVVLQVVDIGVGTAPPSPTTVSVTAPSNATVGNTFTARINVGQVTDLAGAQYDIVFDPAVLTVENPAAGFDITNGVINATVFTVTNASLVSGGRVRVINTLVSGVSGTGYLSDVKFKVIGPAGAHTPIPITLEGITTAAYCGRTCQRRALHPRLPPCQELTPTPR